MIEGVGLLLDDYVGWFIDMFSLKFLNVLFDLW